MEATQKVSAADGASDGSQEPPHPTDTEEEERVQQLTSGELTSAASFGPGDGRGYDASNRFRSNIESVEKPRQIVVLVATIAGASYLVSREGRVCSACVLFLRVRELDYSELSFSNQQSAAADDERKNVSCVQVYALLFWLCFMPSDSVRPPPIDLERGAAWLDAVCSQSRQLLLHPCTRTLRCMLCCRGL